MEERGLGLEDAVPLPRAWWGAHEWPSKLALVSRAVGPLSPEPWREALSRRSLCRHGGSAAVLGPGTVAVTCNCKQEGV